MSESRESEGCAEIGQFLQGMMLVSREQLLGCSDTQLVSVKAPHFNAALAVLLAHVHFTQYPPLALASGHPSRCIRCIMMKQ
jgi:hypothetical protein